MLREPLKAWVIDIPTVCDIVKTRFIVQAALLWLVTCFASEADHSMGSFPVPEAQGLQSIVTSQQESALWSGVISGGMHRPTDWELSHW